MRVVNLHREVRIAFSGRDEYDRRYEGILQLSLRLGTQHIHGTQQRETEHNEWVTEKFSVTGEFADRRFDVFEGRWSEPGGSCLVGVYGLPATKQIATTRKSLLQRAKRGTVKKKRAKR